jgi:DNA-binding response OmpR family regulator
MTSVLIVEDEKHLADGLRYNLEAEGYSVDAVADAETALENLKDKPDGYDVVVLDVMLPGMDGFAFASKLRAQGQFVPILMLTARGQAEDVLRGFEAGADDYLPKPFELGMLIARIHALLRRREWFRRSYSSSLVAQ